MKQTIALKRVLAWLIIGTGCIGAGAHADPLEARRDAFRQALEQADRGKLSAAPRSLADHPLAAYLQLARYRQQPALLTPERVRAFRAEHAGQPVVELLDAVWRDELARRGDWPQWLVEDIALDTDAARCHQAKALFATGQNARAEALTAELWLRGDSAPPACDAAFAQWERLGTLDAAMRWQRILLAADQSHASLMRFVARKLPATDQARAERYAGFVESPSVQARSWVPHSDDAQVVRAGLVRMARTDVAAAERLFDQLADPLQLDANQRGAVLGAIALWSAASYEADSARRFARVPAHAFDARLHEWRAREALARDDYAGLLQAIAQMPEVQRGESRWRYLAARMQQMLGQTSAAAAALALLAREANYHGFLAADHSASSYALCPREPSDDPAIAADVAADPGLVRALELHALGRPRWALHEWNHLLKRLDDERRRVAIERAIDAGWTDRAVFDLNQGDDLQFYRLRFPLAHKRHLTRTAKREGIDAAWVAALIRAESAWQPGVRSHANAYGLMQLLPSTGQAKARQLGLGWHGTRTLYDPVANITLGTAYLAEMLDARGRQPYLATAAYNAGPAPVSRWQQQRPPRDADLWVETIPYRETRDYVARVMAFSVIYDWRLGRAPYPLSARLLGQPDAKLPRRVFQCPDSPPSVAVR
jgi:soluble lytic murein transglycosylase